jgi:DNA repair exonuclease SbcCD ATPase subunit
MQILAIALYSKTPRPPRIVRFRPNRLNILTGKSKTGKSALLDIVDFCLGRTEITLPLGTITDVTSWYATLVEVNGSRLVLARPNPDGSTTNQAMISVGGRELDVPASNDQLVANADSNALRAEISRRLGIESFRIEPTAGSLRYPYDASVAQAVLFCLQKQSEIASQTQLFHRQEDSGIEQSIRDTLPYFLGAAGPDIAQLRYELRSAQRALRRAERDAAQRDAESDSYANEIVSLARTAVAFGAIDETVLDSPLDEIIEHLTSAASFTTDPTIPESDPEVETRRQELLEVRRTLRSELDYLESQVRLVNSIQTEGVRFQQELQIQGGRLATLNLVPQDIGDSSHVCPLCSSELPEADPTLAEIANLAERVSSELSRVDRARPASNRRLAQLADQISQLRVRLRDNGTQLDEITAAENEINQNMAERERLAYLRGRLASALERMEPLTSAGLTPALDTGRYQRTIAELESQLAAADAESEISSRLALISRQMTVWAQRLELEHSQYNVRLDPKNLTVIADKPEGAHPLRRIGSAENWIGYHLVSHLGLHWWFSEHQRPVPRFIMFDQPTQAFFPEKVQDASEVDDADWAAVQRQFELLRDFIAETSGQIQVIVCDHANLTDEPWFQDALVENWRYGNALIPADWID